MNTPGTSPGEAILVNDAIPACLQTPAASSRHTRGLPLSPYNQTLIQLLYNVCLSMISQKAVGLLNTEDDDDGDEMNTILRGKRFAAHINYFN